MLQFNIITYETINAIGGVVSNIRYQWEFAGCDGDGGSDSPGKSNPPDKKWEPTKENCAELNSKYSDFINASPGILGGETGYQSLDPNNAHVAGSIQAAKKANADGEFNPSSKREYGGYVFESGRDTNNNPLYSFSPVQTGKLTGAIVIGFPRIAGVVTEARPGYPVGTPTLMANPKIQGLYHNHTMGPNTVRNAFSDGDAYKVTAFGITHSMVDFATGRVGLLDSTNTYGNYGIKGDEGGYEISGKGNNPTNEEMRHIFDCIKAGY